MQSVQRIAAALVVAAVFFGFTAEAALADTTGLVRGTATLAGRRPATGVAVTLSGEGATLHATTDGKGGFIFSRVPFGRYTLAFHREGSPDVSQSVDVQSDAVVSVTVELTGLREIARTQVAVTARGVSA